jgi:hypothetical protein
MALLMLLIGHPPLHEQHRFVIRQVLPFAALLLHPLRQIGNRWTARAPCLSHWCINHINSKQKQGPHPPTWLSNGSTLNPSYQRGRLLAHGPHRPPPQTPHLAVEGVENLHENKHDKKNMQRRPPPGCRRGPRLTSSACWPGPGTSGTPRAGTAPPRRTRGTPGGARCGFLGCRWGEVAHLCV